MYNQCMVMVEESYLPLTLYAPGLTDARFQEFCEQYADYRLEYSAEGELIIMPPTDPRTGFRNARITTQLMNWALSKGTGIVTDSSAGFILPNGARLSPDAAWVSRAQFAQRHPLPEFVIELLSPTDRTNLTHKKMLEWIANGVQLAWMIDPRAQSVTVYRPGQPQEFLTSPTQVKGEGPVEGFVLDLTAIWSI